MEGDQRMSDESVDVERRVGMSLDVNGGLHDSDVTPASCPTRRASNVTENSWELASDLEDRVIVMVNGWDRTSPRKISR